MGPFMNRISITLVFFISILFCENSLFSGSKSRKEPTKNIPQCNSRICKKNGHINKKSSAKTKTILKNHLDICSITQYKFNRLTRISLLKGETPIYFNAFTKKRTHQRERKPNKPKKPLTLQGYCQIECHSYNHTLYSKKNPRQHYRLKHLLMKHLINCKKFNDQYFKEFQDKRFSTTTLKKYAISYAHHTKIIDLGKLNNN